eukprot:10174130-Lingulodinium_polyedra.AAC.1
MDDAQWTLMQCPSAPRLCTHSRIATMHFAGESSAAKSRCKYQPLPLCTNATWTETRPGIDRTLEAPHGLAQTLRPAPALHNAP